MSAGRVLGRLQLAIVNSVGASWWLTTSMRARLFTWCGLTVHPGAAINSGQRISSHGITIGYSFINVGCLLDAGDSTIEIGDRVALATGVTLNAVTHEIGDEDSRMGANRSAPIRIGDGAWLGTNAVVLAGVTIGAGAVVAANSLVRRDVPPNTLVAGVPAVEIRRLPASSPDGPVSPDAGAPVRRDS